MFLEHSTTTFKVVFKTFQVKLLLKSSKISKRRHNLQASSSSSSDVQELFKSWSRSSSNVLMLPWSYIFISYTCSYWTSFIHTYLQRRSSDEFKLRSSIFISPNSSKPFNYSKLHIIPNLLWSFWTFDLNIYVDIKTRYYEPINSETLTNSLINNLAFLIFNLLLVVS